MTFFFRCFTAIVALTLLLSCAGTEVQTEEPLVDTYTNYMETVKEDGSAAALISKDAGIGELQKILQYLIRETEAGLTIRGKKTAGDFPANPLQHRDPSLHEEVEQIKEDIYDLECQCTELLFNVRVDAEELVSKLLRLDSLTTELATSIDRNRPLVNHDISTWQ